MINGPVQHPGANYIRRSNGFVIHLAFADRARAAKELRVGDTVERHLADGDPVLFNRQVRDSSWLRIDRLRGSRHLAMI